MRKRNAFTLILWGLMVFTAACQQNTATQPETTESTNTAEPTSTSAKPASASERATNTSEESASASANDHAPSFTAGTYIGTGKGRNGDVEVEITFDENRILSVEVVKSRETKNIGSVALEKMADRMVELQQVPDMVSGATQSSVAMYTAMVDAIQQAGGDKDALTASIEYDAPSQSVAECDVVVVGAGGAGMTAAIDLKKAGFDVILIEKEGIFGGTSLTASSYVYGYGTSVHEKAGLEMTSQEYYDTVVSVLFPGLVAADADMAMKYAEIVPSTMEEYMSYGADLTNLIDGAFEMGPSDGSTVGGTLAPALIQECERLGVDMRPNTKATSLLQESGKVTGVEISTRGGSYEIHADAVIMATGGYQQNKEMMAKYAPEYSKYGTTYSVGSTGEGMEMCEAVGAYLGNMNVLQLNPTGHRIEQADNLLSFSNFRYYGCILVGQSTGTRFANELGDYTSIAKAMPQDQAYAVFDETVFQSSSAIREYYELGYITKADTIEELAGQIGLDPAVLKDTVDKYTEAAIAGEDTEFGRPLFPSDLTTAPYYATAVEPVVHNHTGGVVTNARGQAVTEADNSAIPGLYVIGTAADNTLQPGVTFSFPYAKLVVNCVMEDIAK